MMSVFVDRYAPVIGVYVSPEFALVPVGDPLGMAWRTLLTVGNESGRFRSQVVEASARRWVCANDEATNVAATWLAARGEMVSMTLTPRLSPRLVGAAVGLLVVGTVEDPEVHRLLRLGDASGVPVAVVASVAGQWTPQLQRSYTAPWAWKSVESDRLGRYVPPNRLQSEPDPWSPAGWDVYAEQHEVADDAVTQSL